MPDDPTKNPAEPLPAQPRPPQFGLRSLLIGTAACGLLFASFRWLGMSPRDSLFVSGLLAASIAGAACLVVAIGRAMQGRD